MNSINVQKKKFVFKKLLRTSQAVYNNKTSYFLILRNDDNPDKYAVGECCFLKGLSPNTEEKIKEQLDFLVMNVNQLTPDDFKEFPSVRFAYEMALKEYDNDRRGFLFPSKFTNGEEGIPIHGLIWMGDEDYMWDQIRLKLNDNCQTLKLKIGYLDWQSELDIIKKIRKTYSKDVLNIRVDANGAFEMNDAPGILRDLDNLGVDLIEQPIPANQKENLKILCKNTPIKIGLDESLIGIYTNKDKEDLISHIKPQCIVIKPSMLGGFKASEEWIDIADKKNVDWFVTSSLESNIGLNAIAQWVYSLQKNDTIHGLGTGQLMMNNISSPLFVNNNELYYNPAISWQNMNIK